MECCLGSMRYQPDIRLLYGLASTRVDQRRLSLAASLATTILPVEAGVIWQGYHGLFLNSGVV
jgi:hypothetical protein